jgi:adenosylcobinamide-GDP ribazoletransferase
MMRRFLAAVQFLTIVPSPSDVSPARAAIFFPLVGALVGLAAGGTRVLAGSVFPAPVAALLALGVMITLTGALHEDGLTDVFDAFRAGRSPERIQAILKDSRIGVYGAVALVMTLLLRWQAITFLDRGAIPALVAAAAASRGAMVVFAHISRPMGEGLGKAFCLGLRRPEVVVAGVLSAAFLFLNRPINAAAALGMNVLAIAAARAYFHRRAGGITGDCIGAVCQITETLTLLTLLCPISI